jgi:hypothetical protein
MPWTIERYPVSPRDAVARAAEVSALYPPAACPWRGRWST